MPTRKHLSRYTSLSSLQNELARRVQQEGMSEERRRYLYDRYSSTVHPAHGARDMHWRRIIKPLSKEINVMENCIRYQKLVDHKLQVAAYTEYLNMLREFRAWLMNQIHNNIPMSQARVRYGIEFLKGIEMPHGGKHWSDWIHPLVKENITQAFYKLPSFKGRFKIPFERPLPPAAPRTLADVQVTNWDDDEDDN